ncbi:hypothetical protein MHL31_05600 [Lutibacter sp. A80]|uniref:hypothetical protein n=1 Tax=Lutibacter sp. A80 TaxID=2918453 RepID=UPI001F06467F|nr:hypothetical protein [Lutibacter sp. A80]UMB61680.1 hypothetical protein MHL31_05600 [Lutibacter sp. A80]
MKNLLFLIIISALAFSCKSDKKSEVQNKEEAIEILDTPKVSLSEFDTKAGDYVGKEIEVTGIVDHVCKHGGKKILLVTDEGDAHIVADERFDEALMGEEIKVIGIVLEERIDEAYLLKMDEDNIKSHSEGASNEEQFNNKKKHLQEYRNKMKKEGIDHISNYSLQYVSHTNIATE